MHLAFTAWINVRINVHLNACERMAIDLHAVTHTDSTVQINVHINRVTDSHIDLHADVHLDFTAWINVRINARINALKCAVHRAVQQPHGKVLCLSSLPNRQFNGQFNSPLNCTLICAVESMCYPACNSATY